MRINSTSLNEKSYGTGRKNTPSFERVVFHRSKYDNMVYVSIDTLKNKDASVEFFEVPLGSVFLGASSLARALTENLKEIGDKIISPENIEKVRTSLKKIFDVNLVKNLGKIPEYTGEKITLGEIIGKVSLADMKLVIEKGNPEFKTYDSPKFKELSIQFDPKEVVDTEVTRQDLSILGKPQP